MWEHNLFVRFGRQAHFCQGQGLDLVTKAQELLSPSRLCPLDECGHAHCARVPHRLEKHSPYAL